MNKQAAVSNVAADVATNLVRRILEELTFHHDALSITVEQAGSIQVIYIRSNKSDMRRVIGKQGAHRNALVNLVEYIGLHYGTRLECHVLEPSESEVRDFEPFRAAHTWDSRGVIQLMRDICSSVFLYETKVELVDSATTLTSVMTVTVSSQEDRRPTARIAQSLQVLFNSIGKRHGRLLMVDVKAE